MTLTPGTRIGVYEVVALVGSGGMGEVYRAIDSRLKRAVALKTLHHAFAEDVDRVARLTREAELLAALNHPNIAAIHGVIDAPSEGDGHAVAVRALVMEFVEGDTLADHLARGPMPLNEALATARQIALALEAAHEQGIIHRDLKPANVKLRDDGTVKVLDFGLAKLADPVAAGASIGSLSPTITSPALMTNAGVLLGTAAYMSPEQAKGRPADKRSDLWAFGSVLFEMLTGKRAFDGEDVSEALASVLRSDPDWTALPTETPAAVRALLRRCLEKDRRTRIADCAAVLFVLDEHPNLIAARPPDDARFRTEMDAAVETVRRSVERRARRSFWGVAAVAALLAAAAVAATWWTLRVPPAKTAWLALPPAPAALPRVAPMGNDLALTSDGTRVVYFTGGNSGETSSLAVMDLHQPGGRVTPLNTIQSGGPFLSADDQWVGFYDQRNDALMKVSIQGGRPVPLAARTGNVRGASWAPDDSIVYGLAAPGGLWRVPADGGKPTALTKPDASRPVSEFHRWPHVLPGGHAALFTTSSGDPGTEQIALVDLQTGRYHTIIPRGTYPRYSPTGHIVYAVDGALFAVGFDLDRLETTTTNPVLVLDRVLTKDSGAADFDIAANGTLVYTPGGSATSNRSIVWMNRKGQSQPVPNLPVGDYRTVRVSPNGQQVVIEVGAEGNSRVWTYDIAREIPTLLTTGDGDARSPVWTTDGRRIAFASNRGGKWGIFLVNADGTGAVQRVLMHEKASELWTDTFDAQGRLLFTTLTPGALGDVAALTLQNGTVDPLLDTPDVEGNPSLSPPDQKWLAYLALRSRVPGIYVERYPGLGDRQAIATNAIAPLWSRNGTELFYMDNTRTAMTAVPIESRDPLVLGKPVEIFKAALFALRGWRTYDVAPDGRFVLIVRNDDGSGAVPTATPQIALDFFQELNAKVPVP